MRKIVLVPAALLLAALTVSCGGGNEEGKRTASYKTYTVDTTSRTVESSYSATIRGRQDIDIYPQVSGTITKVCVTEGQKVRKGDILFIIDQVPYKAALMTAEANVAAAEAGVATAQLTYDSKVKLFDEKVISQFELQSAENALLTAKATLAQCEAQRVNAENNLSYTTVSSPADGVVGTIPYRQGALVSSAMAQPLTTISDNSQMYVYFSLTEKELLNLTRAGGTLDEQLAKMPEVQLELADGSIYAEKGKIDAVSGVIDQTTGSVSMRAIFPNKQNILRSGGMANVIFPYTMENVLLVPQSATVDIQDKKFVYVLQPDSTVKYTEIRISNLNDGKNYIVLDGLKSGEKIAVEGVTRLNDGMKITPITPEQKEAKYQQALKDQREGNIATAFN